MRRRALAAGAVIVALSAGFVYLFGSGAVFGQEAGFVPTTKAIVQTRVLGDDLVRLDTEGEKYIATYEGTDDYLRLMEARGLTLVDRAGGGMFFRHRDGRRCGGTVEMFTAELFVYRAPACYPS
jgi:hypothetical protein